MRSKIKKVSGKFVKSAKTKDGRALIENFASLSIVQFANYILPLISLPYLTRVIGVEKFGVLSMATAIILYFQTFVDFGFDFSATKEIARNRNNPNAVSKIFSTTMFAKFYLLLVSIVALLILSFTVPYIKNNLFVIWVTFLMLPGHIFFPSWFFQGMEKMKFTALLNLVSKALFTFLVFVVILNESDYIYYPVLTTLGLVVSGVIALYIILKKFDVKVIVPSWCDVKEAYKSSYDVFLNLLFPNFYNGMTTILLGAFHGDYFVGVYSAAKRFIMIVDRVMSLFTRTFFPFLARKINVHDIFAKGILFLSIFSSLVLFLFADPIIHIFFGNKFNDAVIILQIMAFSILFLQLGSTYGTNYLLLIDKAKVLRKITMYVSVFGFFLTLALTYYYSAKGAAVAILLTRAILGSTIYLFARYYKRLKTNII